MTQVPYKFVFSHEGITLYALLTPVEDYPTINVDGHPDLNNFYNCVDDTIAAEVDRIGAQEQFYAESEKEAWEFLEQALVGIATIARFDMKHAQRIVI